MANQIIGNTSYKDIREKAYINGTSEEISALAAELEKAGISFSGRIGYRSAVTVEAADRTAALEIMRSLKTTERKSTPQEENADKNIIGNTDYRYIKDKRYVKGDTETIMRVADRLAAENISFSGRLNGDTATLTVSGSEIQEKAKKYFAEEQERSGSMRTAYMLAQNSDGFEDGYYISEINIETGDEVQPYRSSFGDIPMFLSVDEAVRYAQGAEVALSNSDSQLTEWRNAEIEAEKERERQLNLSRSREIIKRLPMTDEEYDEYFVLRENAVDWIYFNPDGADGEGQFVVTSLYENDLLEAYNARINAESREAAQDAFIGVIANGTQRLINADTEDFEKYALSCINAHSGNRKDVIVSGAIVEGSGYDSNFERIIRRLENHFDEVKNYKNSHINDRSDNISVEGHRGTWYVIDSEEIEDRKLFLLEHEQYGDEAANIIIDENNTLIMEDVYNGFDDYRESMQEENISLSEQLFELAKKELAGYENSLDTAEKAKAAAYELSVKRDILSYIEYDLSADIADGDVEDACLNLIRSGYPLDTFYQDWLKNEYDNRMEAIRMTAADTFEKIAENSVGKDLDEDYTAEKENTVQWKPVLETEDEETGRIGSYSAEVDGSFYWITENENHRYDIEYDSGAGIAPISKDYTDISSRNEAEAMFEDYIYIEKIGKLSGINRALRLDENPITFSVVTIDGGDDIVVGEYIDEDSVRDMDEYIKAVSESNSDTVDVQVHFYTIGNSGTEAVEADKAQAEYISEHLGVVLSNATLLETNRYDVEITEDERENIDRNIPERNLEFTVITFEDDSVYIEAGEINDENVNSTAAYEDMMRNNFDIDKMEDLDENIKAKFEVYRTGDGEPVMPTEKELAEIRSNSDDFIGDKAPVSTSNSYLYPWKNVDDILYGLEKHWKEQHSADPQISDDFDGSFYLLPEQISPSGAANGVPFYDTYSAVNQVKLTGSEWLSPVDAVVEMNRRGIDLSDIEMLNVNLVDVSGNFAQKDITPEQFAVYENRIDKDRQAYSDILSSYAEMIKKIEKVSALSVGDVIRLPADKENPEDVPERYGVVESISEYRILIGTYSLNDTAFCMKNGGLSYDPKELARAYNFEVIGNAEELRQKDREENKEIYEALANHDIIHLSQNRSEEEMGGYPVSDARKNAFFNLRIEFNETDVGDEIDSGFVLKGDTDKGKDFILLSYGDISPEIMYFSLKRDNYGVESIEKTAEKEKAADLAGNNEIAPKSSISFGRFGNGVLCYDTSRIDEEINDYFSVAHISAEGNIRYYTDDLAENDKQLIENQAKTVKEEFTAYWNSLSLQDRYSRLYDSLLDTGNFGQIRAFEADRSVTDISEKIKKYEHSIIFKDEQFPNEELFSEHDRSNVEETENAINPLEVIEKARESAHNAGLPFREAPADEDPEDFNPYVFDGTMSPEDYELMHKLMREDSFEIYQVKSGEEYRNKRFAGLSELDGAPNIADYDLVYSGRLAEQDITVQGKDEILESVFTKFNMDRPEDFEGHSLSVSDIVVLHKDGEDTAHFVDTIGFSDVPEFLKEKNKSEKLPNEELFSEQDLSILREIKQEHDRINNEKEREEAAQPLRKSGKDNFYEPRINDIVEKDDNVYKITDISEKHIKLLEADTLLPSERTVRVDDFHTKGYSLVARAEVVQDTPDNAEDYKDEIVPKAENFSIADDTFGNAGGAKSRYAANIEAIKTLKKIEAEKRGAAPEEQAVLAAYTGWGAIPQAFDPDNDKWSDEYKELKELLTDDEYSAARKSTMNAHYTSPTVISAIYDGLHNLGFEGGKILEPAMGIGNFFGAMPENIQNNSELHGVELDSITGRIAQQLYPNADVKIKGFEAVSFADNSFDAAVGNVPFGDYSLNDKRYNDNNFLIHDYFFAKALDKVRPGGVVAFVTSKGTLDKENSDVRKYFAERAELLGAVRLPNNAFKANAGTEVTSDIIFLQKRDKPIEIDPDSVEWLKKSETADGLSVNNYFVKHPEMVLGKIVEGNKLYGHSSKDTSCIPIEGADLKQQLAQAMKNIKGSYKEGVIEAEAAHRNEDIIPAPENSRTFSFCVSNGELYFREDGDTMKKVEGKKDMLDRAIGLTELRDNIHELLNLQLNNAGGNFDGEIAESRKRLNERYDGFTAAHGNVSNKANAKAMSRDDGYSLVAALEQKDEKGNVTGKADIFFKNTVKPKVIAAHVDTAEEALILSVAEKGRIDFDFMTELCGMDKNKLTSELEGQIYRLPQEREKYVTADEYLTGNIRKKLRELDYAPEGMDVSRHREALEAAMPPRVEAKDISVKLGAHWVDPEYISDFIKEKFNPDYKTRCNLETAYSSVAGTWKIEGVSATAKNNYMSTSTYGTKRINAYQIMEGILNNSSLQVKDRVKDEFGNDMRDSSGKYVLVVNDEETKAVRHCANLIKSEYADWIFKDPDRREALVQKYNETYNSIRHREYDGSHLNFVGMNTDITLKEHQKNAVARALYGGNTLLAHAVGAGKSATRS